ncbi:hypothetical protein [Streptomyces sp. NPDC008121]|uniref:hypothetical protein n=1 Tax=Streptomyces sp. NPDC008121 TaxID=3364809 RepID=UPI0036EEC727
MRLAKKYVLVAALAGTLTAGLSGAAMAVAAPAAPASAAQSAADGAETQGLVFNTVKVTNSTGSDLTVTDVRVMDSSRPYDESLEHHMWMPKKGDVLKNEEFREYGVTAWMENTPVVEVTLTDAAGNVAIYATSAKTDGGSEVSRPGSNYYAAGEPAGAGQVTSLDLRNPAWVSVHNNTSHDVWLWDADAREGTYLKSPGTRFVTKIAPGGELAYGASTPAKPGKDALGTSTSFNLEIGRESFFYTIETPGTPGDPVTCKAYEGAPACTVTGTSSHPVVSFGAAS